MQRINISYSKSLLFLILPIAYQFLYIFVSDFSIAAVDLVFAFVIPHRISDMRLNIDDSRKDINPIKPKVEPITIIKKSKKGKK
jgi:hypothetical protein